MKEPSDELQTVWQQAGGQLGKEEHSMTLRLAQDRRAWLLDVLREQNRTAYVISLSFAPLTAFAAWKGRPSPWLLSGYLLMTATLVAGALVVWLGARRARLAERFDLTRREHQRQLIRLCDERIRFVDSTKYWYAGPLFLGAGLVGYRIGALALGDAGAVVATAVLLAACWLGVWRQDRRATADLRRKREELQGLLAEMDEE